MDPVEANVVPLWARTETPVGVSRRPHILGARTLHREGVPPRALNSGVGAACAVLVNRAVQVAASVDLPLAARGVLDTAKRTSPAYDQITRGYDGESGRRSPKAVEDFVSDFSTV